MKCPNCDYEIEKANLKTCPLCGSSLEMGEKEEYATKNNAAIEEQQNMEVADEKLQETYADNIPEVQQPVCPRCQKPMPANVNFCPYCGFDIREQTNGLLKETVTDVEEQMSEQESIKSTHETMQFQYETRRSEESEEEVHVMPTHSASDENYDDIDEENPPMGGYFPYPDEENVDMNNNDETATDASKPWLTIVLSTIASILIGAIIYLLTQ